MSRRRWVQQTDGSLLEVTGEDCSTPREARHTNPLAGDRHYDGLRATDGTDISTRTKHRNYMRARGLTTADDFKVQWSKSAEQRSDHFTSGSDHGARREAVAEAVHRNLDKRR